MNIPWDFVVQYYGDYSSSDDILEAEWLYQIVTGDYSPGSGAEEYLQAEYGGDKNNPQIQLDYDACYRRVYEHAIEGYIRSLQTT